MKRKVKSIIALILMLIMSLTMLAPAYAIDPNEPETKATALKQLGLFKGVSDTSFALYRAPTRTEALVMLIRAMGKESEALSGSWSHPFTDVASWADKYVGYAYEKGLTKGVSATQFGAENASSNMYLTFILRALGYDDSKGDFKWDAPDTLAKEIGILPDSVDTSNFQRADVAIISWAALEATLKGASQTLSQKLMDMGLFCSEEYAHAKLFVEDEGGITVVTVAELQFAVGDETLKVLQIGSDMEISGEMLAARGDGPEMLIFIKPGVALTVNGELITVGYFVLRDGKMVVNVQ